MGIIGWILLGLFAGAIAMVEARDRTVAKFAPEIPVPCPYAWGYRLGRRLELPLVSAVEPERIKLQRRTSVWSVQPVEGELSPMRAGDG